MQVYAFKQARRGSGQKNDLQNVERQDENSKDLKGCTVIK